MLMWLLANEYEMVDTMEKLADAIKIPNTEFALKILELLQGKCINAEVITKKCEYAIVEKYKNLEDEHIRKELLEQSYQVIHICLKSNDMIVISEKRSKNSSSSNAVVLLLLEDWWSGFPRELSEEQAFELIKCVKFHLLNFENLCGWTQTSQLLNKNCSSKDRDTIKVLYIIFFIIVAIHNYFTWAKACKA